jgi:hypothetical protein
VRTATLAARITITHLFTSDDGCKLIVSQSLCVSDLTDEQQRMLLEIRKRKMELLLEIQVTQAVESTPGVMWSLL